MAALGANGNETVRGPLPEYALTSAIHAHVRGTCGGLGTKDDALVNHVAARQHGNPGMGSPRLVYYGDVATL